MQHARYRQIMWNPRIMVEKKAMNHEVVVRMNKASALSMLLFSAWCLLFRQALRYSYAASWLGVMSCLFIRCQYTEELMKNNQKL